MVLSKPGSVILKLTDWSLPCLQAFLQSDATNLTFDLELFPFIILIKYTLYDVYIYGSVFILPTRSSQTDERRHTIIHPIFDECIKSANQERGNEIYHDVNLFRIACSSAYTVSQQLALQNTLKATFKYT